MLIVGLIVAVVIGTNIYGSATTSHKSSYEPVQNHYAYSTSSFNSSVREAMSGGTHCSVADFTIKGLSGSNDYGYAKIVGTIVNNCSEPAGLQVKATLYNSSGGVVSTEDAWPASISNIPPHVPYPFNIMLSSESGWTKYGVRPIDAKRW